MMNTGNRLMAVGNTCPTWDMGLKEGVEVGVTEAGFTRHLYPGLQS